MQFSSKLITVYATVLLSSTRFGDTALVSFGGVQHTQDYMVDPHHRFHGQHSTLKRDDVDLSPRDAVQLAADMEESGERERARRAWRSKHRRGSAAKSQREFEEKEAEDEAEKEAEENKEESETDEKAEQVEKDEREDKKKAKESKEENKESEKEIKEGKEDEGEKVKKADRAGEEAADNQPNLNTSTFQPLPSAPPKAPLEDLFDDADEVARDVELRRSSPFLPEGSNPSLDVTAAEQREVDDIFALDPLAVFGHCVLVRDYAEPLRVGNALIRRASSLRVSSHMQGRFLGGHRSDTRAQVEGHEVQDEDVEDEADIFPSEMLLPEGGVVDRDFVAQGGNRTADAELQVSMFAFLRSIAGEVAVVPTGIVAKWTSKRRVPIAGYLCTDKDGPTLHTLPTPCLPTALDNEGMPIPPPIVPSPFSDASDVKPKQDKTKVAEDEVDDMDGDEDAQEGNLTDPASAFFQRSHALIGGVKAFDRHGKRIRRGQGPSPAPAMSPVSAPGSSPASAPGPAPASGEKANIFPVFVGNTRLTFSSKPKAERFCTRLAHKIAKEMGDYEWDGAEEQAAEDAAAKIHKMDPSVSSFVQVARRQTAPEWTKGTKSLLVVVMDWLEGDRSRAPFSQQTRTPDHYKEKVFPRVREAFHTMSHGKFDLDVTFVPEVVRYTRPRSRYAVEGYPFPGLYNGARDSLEGSAKFDQTYNFDNYDLVYVINPQQGPTGTKGVAWVGAKGAICNGCEDISENFQVMVAVHELGHNLGLLHAGSKSLEYGNVFDWMGNYPDVDGLSFGLGYKLALGWTPRAVVHKVTNADLPMLNDEFFLKPFDNGSEGREGDIMGIQVSLGHADRDLYIAYRHDLGDNKGIYLTLQDKDKPNNELVDCACHSPSQQDARLRPGWTYVDPSQQVVVHVKAVTDEYAAVHVYRAPLAADLAKIRGRSGFTDGQWRCPRTCTDSDLLVSQYDGCGKLAADGYCRGGSITMGGTKWSIATGLCPSSCGECEAVMQGSNIVSDGCDDRRVTIGGRTCAQAARVGQCEYNTNIGNIGFDLCPRSCGKCPRMPAGASSDRFNDPAPSRSHGSTANLEANLISELDEEKVAKYEAEEEAEEEHRAEQQEKQDAAEEEERTESKTNQGEIDHACTDDPVWSDLEGDGCKVYHDYISSGRLLRAEACEYNGGGALAHCRKTCGTCKETEGSSGCADKECVAKWHHETGQCFPCMDWATSCGEEHFAADCPRTCGKCVGPTTTVPVRHPSLTEQHAEMTATTTASASVAEVPTLPPLCEDSPCVEPWQQSSGRCFKCEDFAEDYCGRDANFTSSCLKTCRRCDPADGSNGPVCQDDFLVHTCKRYAKFGWCSQGHVLEHCKATCGVCAERALHLEQGLRPASHEHSAASARNFQHALFAALLASTLLAA